VRLVHLRGRFMQEATPPGVGAMAAIVGLDARTVADTCLEAAQGDVCSPANLNGAGQTVIAGHAGAVARAAALARQKGAKLVKTLAVSAPFHSALMQPAADRLAAALEPIRVKTPRIPVVHNVTGQANLSADRIKQLLIDQVTAPVRWEESVKLLAELGCRRALELGPGTVLAGLVKRIAPEIETRSVGESKDIVPWS